MRMLLALLLLFTMAVFPACSSEAQEQSLYREALANYGDGDLAKAKESATRLIREYPTSENAGEARVLLMEIEIALQKEQEAKEAARIQAYTSESESCRQKVVEAHLWVCDQYSSLVSEYERQKQSLDYVEWSAFLHGWNSTLRTYREEMNALKVNGHTPNLFSAWKWLEYAAGHMNGAIWLCYDNAVLGKNPELFGREDLIYFDKEIRGALTAAKGLLDAGG